MMILGNATKLVNVEEQEKKNSASASEIGTRIQSQVARQLVDIEILYLLNFGAKSGYELRKSLSKSFGIKISYGTLYPHLHALERSSLISGTWSSQKEETTAQQQVSLKKRVYDLTVQGTNVLKESIERLGSLSMTMQFLLNKVDLRQRTSEIKSETREALLNSVCSILSAHNQGFERLCVERGSSGLDHPIELLAKGRAGTGRTIIRIIEPADNFDLDQALKALVISNDVQAKTMILASPPLSKEVSGTCTFYHMQVFEGKDWQSVLATFESSLNS